MLGKIKKFSIAGKLVSRRSGFTLVEMMVTIAIALILSGVLLANYRQFSRDIALRGVVNEAAAMIRQAQGYAAGVREDTQESNEFNRAYGVYFNESDPRNTILFIDRGGKPIKNYDYVHGNGCGSVGTHCFEQYTAPPGYEIQDICASETKDPADLDCTIKRLIVMFIPSRYEYNDEQLQFIENNAGSWRPTGRDGFVYDPDGEVWSYAYARVRFVDPEERTKDLYIWWSGFAYIE